MKRKYSFIPFGIAVAIAAVGAGAIFYARTHQAADEPTAARSADDRSVPQPILPEALPTPQPSGSDKQVTIYQVATDDNGSHLKKVDTAVSADSATENAQALAALNAMAAESDSPLPVGTHAESFDVDAKGVATVDFNQAFVDKFKGGDEAEALTINAVLATIGQFGPHSVQITVAGKKIDSLGGNLSLTNPIPVPQASEQTAQSGGKP